jgi:hypothetical protein
MRICRHAYKTQKNKSQNLSAGVWRLRGFNPAGVSSGSQRWSVNNRRLNGKNLHKWVKNLPIGHLQLARQALRERESWSTIGEMINSIERGELYRSSPTAARRIDRTLNALLRTLGDGRPDNWDRFRKVRPPLLSYKAIYFASPCPRALGARERKLALAKAHLSRRAIRSPRELKSRQPNTKRILILTASSRTRRLNTLAFILLGVREREGSLSGE